MEKDFEKFLPDLFDYIDETNKNNKHPIRRIFLEGNNITLNENTSSTFLDRLSKSETLRYIFIDEGNNIDKQFLEKMEIILDKNRPWFSINLTLFQSTFFFFFIKIIKKKNENEKNIPITLLNSIII